MRFSALCLALLTAAFSSAAWGQALSPGDRLAAAIEDSSEVTTRYAPYVIIRGSVEEEDLAQLWSRAGTLRCEVTCEREASRLVAFLRDSVKLVGQCPRGYRFQIEVKNSRGELMAQAFGDATWRCVQTNHGAFALRSSMLDFLETHWPPKWPDQRSSR